MRTDPRRARLRRPPVAHTGGGTDFATRPRIAASPPSRLSRSGRRAAIGPDFRELSGEVPPAAADLRWRVQSGPYFEGEGDGDGSAGWKHIGNDILY
ncbi:Forkhead box protein O4 [Manis javanica]|nr:Forkhead box protein O4 [Manis javanica]